MPQKALIHVPLAILECQFWMFPPSFCADSQLPRKLQRLGFLHPDLQLLGETEPTQKALIFFMQSLETEVARQLLRLLHTFSSDGASGPHPMAGVIPFHGHPLTFPTLLHYPSPVPAGTLTRGVTLSLFGLGRPLEMHIWGSLAVFSMDRAGLCCALGVIFNVSLLSMQPCDLAGHRGFPPRKEVCIPHGSSHGVPHPGSPGSHVVNNASCFPSKDLKALPLPGRRTTLSSLYR